MALYCDNKIHTRLIVLLLIVSIGQICSCGLSEGEFIAGAEYDSCQSLYYACSGKPAASCVMGEAKYTDGYFPGQRWFLVSTVADTDVVVKLFFKTRIHPGEDMEIGWYETGCSSYYSYIMGLGEDLFSLAGGDRIFSKEYKVRRAGDHLVYVESDATAEYLLRVELKTPM